MKTASGFYLGSAEGVEGLCICLGLGYLLMVMMRMTVYRLLSTRHHFTDKRASFAR